MKLARYVLLFFCFSASLSAACGGAPGRGISYGRVPSSGISCGKLSGPSAYSLDIFELGAGYTYRHDSLEYKLKNTCFGINSERDFKNININQFTAYGKCLTRDHFYMRGYGDYGWVDKGSTTEKSSFDSIMTFEHKGCVSEVCTYDVSLAVGYQFDFCTTNFRVAPLFGYSWHVQYFRSHDDKIVYDTEYNLPGCTELDFKDSYKPNWFGPWVGVDAEYDCYCNWSILVSLEYHWADFRSEFRRHHVYVDLVDFPSIERDDYGCGEGFIGNVGLRNELCPNWSLLLMCSLQTWNLHHGLTKDNYDVMSELTSLRWNTIQTTVAIGYDF